MKNLVPPEILAAFRKDPLPVEDIIKFLDDNPDISTSYLCKLIGIQPRKIYDHKFHQRQKVARPDKATVTPKTASRKYNRYTAEEKYVLIENYSMANGEERAELLRKYGIYQSDIDRWKEQAKEASLAVLGKRKTRSDKKSEDQIKIEALEKELKQQEKTTAKLSTLLVLQKKTFDMLKGED